MADLLKSSLMQKLMNPVALAREKTGSKEILRQRVRKQMEHIIPDVDESSLQPGLRTAEALCGRERLVDALTNFLVDGATGVRFQGRLQPEWAHNMKSQGFHLQSHRTKPRVRIYGPEISAENRQSLIRNKPYHDTYVDK